MRVSQFLITLTLSAREIKVELSGTSRSLMHSENCIAGTGLEVNIA
jgi:N-methylhydantoinase B/oxoprolinase/acetone carboxylase alpha subunit